MPGLKLEEGLEGGLTHGEAGGAYGPLGPCGARVGWRRLLVEWVGHQEAAPGAGGAAAAAAAGPGGAARPGGGARRCAVCVTL